MTRRRWGILIASALVVLVVIIIVFISISPKTPSLAGKPQTTSTVGAGGGTPGTASHLSLVGQSSLYQRGMNAALAIYQQYVYIGNRTDGSNTCGSGDSRGPGNACPHPHPGVLIVSAADPAHPNIVGEIGPPFEGNVGITSRELRVWPQQKLLIVMNFRCSAVLHACPQGTDAVFPFDLKFFDLSDPVHPRFIKSYVPASKAGRPLLPHEMFLWTDPHNANRALLYLSTPTLSVNTKVPNLLIADISHVATGGAVTEVAEGNWNNLYPQANNPANYNYNLIVHSMGVTADGNRAYLAMEAGEFLVLDTSDVAKDVANPQLRLLTDPANRPLWGNPAPCSNTCPNGHSAVQVPGRPFALTTDEVYGTATDRSFGCPWGWVHMISLTDPAHPKIVGQYNIAQDQPSFCSSQANDALTEQFTSYSSHNPTVLPDLAFVSWHSGGLQAIDISNPDRPTQAGWFSPTPLPQVANEDPALGGGPNKVQMWSYPIISNGLIYVVDIRNGLYILRYTGPHADEVSKIHFLEGNSNLGDALTLG
ncbi:MAG TPA: hypothetical protein VKY19_10255 [Ktedonosporobacter sp.]|jgi:hypothetical protein|nr:hypothetical protein [Ktedonosporobacter sp.]